MNRTAVRVCVVIVFCLMFSSVRTSQTMAAAATNTHSREPDFLHEDSPFSTLVHGYCTVNLQGRLTGICGGISSFVCVSGSDPHDCPGMPHRGNLIRYCNNKFLVDLGSPC